MQTRSKSKQSFSPHSTFPIAGFLACLQYGLASVLLTLSNRALFVKLKFNFPVIVTIIQLVLSLISLTIFRHFNILPIKTVELRSIIKVVPVSLFWGLYVISGVVALQYLNISTYNALRRTTPLVVAFIEALFFSKFIALPRLLSLVVAATGAMIAAYDDVELNYLGFVSVSICVVSTGVYLILIKFTTQTLQVNEHTLLYYNNIICLPLSIMYLISGTNEIAGLGRYPGSLTSPTLLVSLFVACSQAVWLNYSIYKCTLVNSPIATSVTGQLKDYAVIILSALFLHDVPSNTMYLMGITLGFIGGSLYVYFSASSGDSGSSRGTTGSRGTTRDSSGGAHSTKEKTFLERIKQS